MSIPGFGDAITLFDLTIRITTFINDLRHAQDDLLGLHAEANTLRICINSVTSDSCHQALYLYITEEQGRDLKTITTTCEDNLRDLNKFIGSCAALIEKDTGVTGIWGRGKDGKRRKFTSKLRKLIAKGWARYKFTMTDKQAFRDKLVLPTQAVNVFLTSMTHVGLARMLMFGSTGNYGGNGAITLPQPSVPVTSGTKDNPDIDSGNKSGGLSGWEVVGKRIAFKNGSIIRKRELTVEVEEEVLEYIRHMLTGDTFTYILTQGKKRYKITKARMTKTRSRSRSKSRGPSGVSKARGSTFVMRKKSASKPAGVVQRITTLRPNDSDSDDGPRNLLALPAPEGSSARYIDIGPPSDHSTDNNSSDNDQGGGGGQGRGRGGAGGGGGGGGRGGPAGDDDDDGGGGGGDDIGPSYGGGRTGRHQDTDASRRRSNYYDDPRFEPDNEDEGVGLPAPELRQEERRDNHRSTGGSQRYSKRMYQNSRVTNLRQRQQETEDRIGWEQEEAVREMERMEEPSRSMRKTHLERTNSLSPEEKEAEERYGEIDDIIRFMDIMYGVVVTPSFGRPPVDNGEVDSDDEGLKFDPLFAPTDKLRAETSLPSMGPDFGPELSYSMEPESYPSRRRTHSYMPGPSFTRIMDPSRRANDRFRYMPRPPYFSSSDDDSSLRGDTATRRGPGPRGPSGGDFNMYTSYERTSHDHRPQAVSPGDEINVIRDNQPRNVTRNTYQPAYVSSDDERKRAETAERQKSDRRRKKKDDSVSRHREVRHNIVFDNEAERPTGGPEHEVYLQPEHRRSVRPSISRRRTSHDETEQLYRSDTDRSREKRQYEDSRLDISTNEDHRYFMRGARRNEE